MRKLSAANSLQKPQELKMKDKNVVKVDFKQAKKKQDLQESKSGKCCQHLDKCAGHSFSG